MVARNIYQDLCEYSSRDIVPMHMPGHKRIPPFAMNDPYRIDVTEVDGTDDLHRPCGIIREQMDEIKSVYGTIESYLLVNGSTCGMLAAVSACCRRGDRVLMDRNCHRCVYHAVYLLELEPVYLYRETEQETGILLGLSVEDVKREWRGDFSCVILTSPTYEGVVSDIAGIAEFVHRQEIPLIVDQAHGAHLAWWKRSGGHVETAVSAGADLVVESLHKTLPALTQTGLLHICSRRVEQDLVERYLDIYETSSPSYVLMASMSQCLQWMMEESGKYFADFEKRLAGFAENALKWKSLRLWDHPSKEPSKLIVCSPAGAISGVRLAEILLQKYGVQVEMAAPGYVIAMTSLCDSEENFSRLAHALEEIDRKAGDAGGSDCMRNVGIGSIRAVKNRKAYPAMNAPWVNCALGASRGRISAEYAFIYPPGIPFLVPGEEITDEVLDRIRHARELGLKISGLQDESAGVIRVLQKGFGNGDSRGG